MSDYRLSVIHSRRLPECLPAELIELEGNYNFKPYIGDHRVRLGSVYLWGNFPIVGFTTIDSRHKQKLFAKTNKDTPNRANVHAKVPFWISEQVRISVQYQMMIDDFFESLP